VTSGTNATIFPAFIISAGRAQKLWDVDLPRDYSRSPRSGAVAQGEAIQLTLRSRGANCGYTSAEASNPTD
jgi:hypothetical protein